MKLPGKISIVGLAVAALLAAASARAGQPVNLLSNGGFEEGLAGWSPAPGHRLLGENSAAHSGRACLTGEVTRPNQALFLRRRVPVKTGNRYDFEVWARATNHTKLVLFAVQPGAADRQAVATFKDVTPRWRRYATSLTVAADGMIELILVAPSSHGAPVGQIWLDDLALYETKMPSLISVSQRVGFNDEPTMAAAADGSVYVAWNSFRDAAADSLQVARFQPQDRGFKSLGRWQVLGGKGTYVLGPRAVSAGEEVVKPV